LPAHFFTNALELKRESWPATPRRDEIATVSGLFAPDFLPHSLEHSAHSLMAELGPTLSHAAQSLLAHFRESARFISRHTGIPAVFVAALLIVLSWRMAKRMAHVAVEVAVVTLLLLALTKLGVVSW
jgi:heme A synthase